MLISCNVNDPDTGVYMHTVKGNGIKYIEFIKQSVFPLFDAGNMWMPAQLYS